MLLNKISKGDTA
jgi:hypothetical protein